MSLQFTAASLLTAVVALYGLGVPLAWLLPAPSASPWLHRIAVAPLYAIVAASTASWILGQLGMRLNQVLLVGMIVAAWVLASWRTRRDWHLREALTTSLAPMLMVATSLALWTMSLRGYGLYLPNRDFKNHAYFVAQVASTGVSDSQMVLRGGPVDPPLDVAARYPLGMHTLLGWALPNSEWNTLGVTAAAAVLVTSVSLPLAMVVLGRLWDPALQALPVIAGFTAVGLPGFTAPFSIGAVPLLSGTALYGCGLAVLWDWLRKSTWQRTLALGVTGVGLLLFHITEAVALAMVMVVCIPGWLSRGRSRVDRKGWTILITAVAVIGVLSALVMRPLLPHVLGGPSDGGDPAIQTDPVTASLLTLLVVVSDDSLVGVLWLPLLLVGVWISAQRRLSRFPVVALAVPLILAVLASWQAVPDPIRVVTVPWFSAIGRIALMAAPAAALVACLTLAWALTAAWTQPHRRLVGRGLALILVSGAVAIPAAGLVPERRQSLRATLAGAGDSAQVGDRLKAALIPGETVLSFEGDGGAHLFAASRVPLVRVYAHPPPEGSDDPYWVAVRGLGNVADPKVARALDQLGVRYIVVGTGSLFWNPEVGYGLVDLVSQPELWLFDEGSDLLVLRYQPDRS